MTASSQELFAYIHPEVVPYDRAFLHISDLSIQRGYGIFDYFKILNGQPLFLADYLERFSQSARLMDLSLPLSPGALKETIYELLRKNNLAASGMKMILTGGYSENGYDPSQPNLILTQHPLVLPTATQVEKGIKIITHNYVREFPTAKTINYSMGIRLIKEIKARGADDVLYHLNGVVSEFPRSNFFIVKQDGTVVTPADNVLKGITRKNVLTLGAKSYQAMEGVVTLEDIRQAKEAFVTSTTKRVLPIIQVDDFPVGNGRPGEITLALLKSLTDWETQAMR